MIKEPEETLKQKVAYMKTIGINALAFATLLAGSIYAVKETSKTTYEKITFRERAKHFGIGSLKTICTYAVAKAYVGILSHLVKDCPTPNCSLNEKPRALCFSSLLLYPIYKSGKSAYHSFARAFRKSDQPEKQKSESDLQIAREVK